LALVPQVLPAIIRQRSGELLLGAVGLLWLAVLLTAIIASILAVDTIGEPGF
jgi:hypothetical protein